VKAGCHFGSVGPSSPFVSGFGISGLAEENVMSLATREISESWLNPENEI
jgi:hypothetical protein